jgi:hypothetical protein
LLAGGVVGVTGLLAGGGVGAAGLLAGGGVEAAGLLAGGGVEVVDLAAGGVWGLLGTPGMGNRWPQPVQINFPASIATEN